MEVKELTERIGEIFEADYNKVLSRMKKDIDILQKQKDKLSKEREALNQEKLDLERAKLDHEKEKLEKQAKEMQAQIKQQEQEAKDQESQKPEPEPKQSEEPEPESKQPEEPEPKEVSISRVDDTIKQAFDDKPGIKKYDKNSNKVYWAEDDKIMVAPADKPDETSEVTDEDLIKKLGFGTEAEK